MAQTPSTVWLQRAARHQEYIAGLEDGTVTRSDLWRPSMSIAEALAVEQRNASYCLAQAALAQSESEGR